MISISRRRLVLASAGLWVVGVVGQNLLGRAAFAQSQPGPMPDNFLAISRLLTDIPLPDPHLAQRLYVALQPLFPQLEQQVDLLAALMAQHANLAGEDFHALIQRQPEPLAALYQSLISGWYLGVIGDPTKPICIAFENIVSYQRVRNALMPPSYCPGEPNFWTHPPRKETAHV
ncbi:Twin-arginine translocation pathway signal [Serratia proteamaculans]|uniref:sugar dehydrogenase complex small subunit n=1 Tax=Serratia proteamaculans TaxID=28151 RepID=UPI0009F7C8AA|nr:sugar dehydrogenase complex small subunit [Serratia proteamaculans]SMB32949.1 Twin-arginine translocation pathway signal [Serratia proteamaculans]